MAGAELADEEDARREGRLFPRASVACIDVGSSRLLLDKAAFRIAFALKTRVKMGRAEAGAALAGPQVGSEANDRIDSRLPPGSRGEECGRVAHRCPIIGAKPVINLRHDGRGELGAHVKAAAAPRGGAPFRLWAMPRGILQQNQTGQDFIHDRVAQTVVVAAKAHERTSSALRRRPVLSAALAFHHVTLLDRPERLQAATVVDENEARRVQTNHDVSQPDVAVNDVVVVKDAEGHAHVTDQADNLFAPDQIERDRVEPRHQDPPLIRVPGQYGGKDRDLWKSTAPVDVPIDIRLVALFGHTQSKGSQRDAGSRRGSGAAVR